MNNSTTEADSTETKTASTQQLNKGENNGIIIVDSCGSQDFFGNLTVVAIYISKNDVQWFKSYEIDLNRAYDNNRPFQIGRDLEGRCLTHVIPIKPEKYNKLYMEIKDAAAWAYSTAVESLLNKVNCQHVICNRFRPEDETLRKYFAMKFGAKNSIFISQDKISCPFAIRSAGILATKGYMGYLTGLIRKFSIQFPRGNGGNIDRVIREFLSKHTYSELEKVGKINLKDVNQIMADNNAVMKWE